MCDFKPGDEVVCILGPTAGGHPDVRDIRPGEVHTVVDVYSDWEGVWLVFGHDPDALYAHYRFRKVRKSNTDLSIESFLTIKPGFEEPRRVKERVGERV